nr:uncharacterized protein LOC110133715 [Odocoileus virginianus texanus]
MAPSGAFGPRQVQFACAGASPTKCFFTADFTFHSSAPDLPYSQTLQRRFTRSSPTQYNYIPSSDTLVITSRRRVRQAVSSPDSSPPFTSVPLFQRDGRPGLAYAFSPKQVLQTSASSALLVPADGPCFPASERSCAGSGQTQLAGGPYLGSVIIEKSTAYFPDALGRRTTELPQPSSLPLVPPPNSDINPFTSMFIGLSTTPGTQIASLGDPRHLHGLSCPGKQFDCSSQELPQETKLIFKSVTFLYTCNDQVAFEMKNTILFTFSTPNDL